MEILVAVVSGEENQGPKPRAVDKGGGVEVTVEDVIDELGTCAERNNSSVGVGREGSGVVEGIIKMTDREETAE